MKAIKSIYYAFDARSIPLSLAQSHADYAQSTLERLFDIKPEHVKVAISPPLTKSDPVRISCYASKSSTDPIAMVQAAKAVLPHLKAMQMRADYLGTEPSEQMMRWLETARPRSQRLDVIIDFVPLLTQPAEA